MCAAYWMDVCSADDGCDWADAAATYPDLSGQYRSLIKNMVSEWTLAGIAVVLDLHLNDDSVSSQQMALKGVNEDEIPAMLDWAHGLGMEMTLIEVMPLGDIEPDRVDQFLPLSVVRERLSERLTLTPLPDRTGGPARYVRVEETGGRLGFITPLTHNFCESCNRVRLTCTGQLYLCLGQEDAADLRAALRASPAYAKNCRHSRTGRRPPSSCSPSAAEIAPKSYPSSPPRPYLRSREREMERARARARVRGPQLRPRPANREPRAARPHARGWRANVCTCAMSSGRS